jgi:integrase
MVAIRGRGGRGASAGHAAVTPKGWIGTDAEVKALAHPGTRKLYRIVGVIGLRLEVRETGSKTWRLNYKTRAGVPRTYVIGQYPETTLAEARKQADAARARVILGGDPQAERILSRAAARDNQKRTDLAAGTSIEALTRRALGLADEPAGMRPLRLRPSTMAEWRRLAAVEVIPAFPAPMQAADLTRDRIRAWGAKIAKRSGYTANRAFEMLRRVFSRAIEDDILNATPFVKLPFPFDGEVQSARVLSINELRLLLLALEQLDTPHRHPDYVAATRLLLLTGTRRAMVLGMRRSELDGIGTPERRWIVPASRSKSGRVHVVPLSPAAERVILTRPAGDILFPLVLPGKTTTLTWSSYFVKRLKATMHAIGPVDAQRWTIHNLRHTVGTHMREDLGIRADVVAMILGHAVPGAQVTRVYDRAELLSERRAALDAWAAWLEKIAPPQP